MIISIKIKMSQTIITISMIKKINNNMEMESKSNMIIGTINKMILQITMNNMSLISPNKVSHLLLLEVYFFYTYLK